MLSSDEKLPPAFTPGGLKFPELFSSLNKAAEESWSPLKAEEVTFIHLSSRSPFEDPLSIFWHLWQGAENKIKKRDIEGAGEGGL